jgi:AcrR family transcriptional regulator
MPNLYRYFESRGEILLALFLEDLCSFAGEVVSEPSGPLPPGSADEEVIASILVDAYAKRPRLCRFLGSIASVLEYNVSARTIGDMRGLSLALGTDVASAIHDALRKLTIERCLWLNNMTAPLVGELWPPAHPRHQRSARFCRNRDSRPCGRTSPETCMRLFSA